ncbi:hypothetical protein [Parenemella sanctibonifatiensis]|uniref:Uncharacterized protein n=1 Tax=Parenemella sanctibonifatiensis TaxID=2016505 RepID=A0A255E8H3_9ACTN|nr:hypothetical protein [Parenemella sanctibonifatiensis]OYN85815.1 hypothetical protein CGZ92_10295 [Parenemella sanctibonifatiensis]
MTELRTLDHTVAGHSIRASIAPAYAAQLTDLLANLAEQPQLVFEGATVQFGWGPIFLEPLEEGSDALMMRIPDYAGEATHERTDDLTAAFATEVAQRDAADLGGLRLQEVLFWQDILLVRGWQDFSGHRLRRMISDVDRWSGWLVTSADHDYDLHFEESEIEHEAAWRVAQLRPELAQVWQFPAGVGVEIRDGQIDHILDLDDDEREVFYNRGDS